MHISSSHISLSVSSVIWEKYDKAENWVDWVISKLSPYKDFFSSRWRWLVKCWQSTVLLSKMHSQHIHHSDALICMLLIIMIIIFILLCLSQTVHTRPLPRVPYLMSGLSWWYREVFWQLQLPRWHYICFMLNYNHNSILLSFLMLWLQSWCRHSSDHVVTVCCYESGETGKFNLTF